MRWVSLESLKLLQGRTEGGRLRLGLAVPSVDPPAENEGLASLWSPRKEKGRQTESGALSQLPDVDSNHGHGD